MNERAVKFSVPSLERNGGHSHLQNGVLLIPLELVGAEKLQTTRSLSARQTLLIALDRLEEILADEGVEDDLVLVVQVLGGALNLRAA